MVGCPWIIVGMMGLVWCIDGGDMGCWLCWGIWLVVGWWFICYLLFVICLVEWLKDWLYGYDGRVIIDVCGMNIFKGVGTTALKEWMYWGLWWLWWLVARGSSARTSSPSEGERGWHIPLLHREDFYTILVVRILRRVLGVSTTERITRDCGESLTPVAQVTQRNLLNRDSALFVLRFLFGMIMLDWGIVLERINCLLGWIMWIVWRCEDWVGLFVLPSQTSIRVYELAFILFREAESCFASLPR